MVDYPEAANFEAPLPAWPVKVACGYLLQNDGNSTQQLKGLAQATGLFYNGTNGNLTCYDIKTEFVFCADQTGQKIFHFISFSWCYFSRRMRNWPEWNRMELPCLH